VRLVATENGEATIRSKACLRGTALFLSRFHRCIEVGGGQFCGVVVF
jgi:hypothetical protein